MLKFKCSIKKLKLLNREPSEQNDNLRVTMIRIPTSQSITDYIDENCITIGVYYLYAGSYNISTLEAPTTTSHFFIHVLVVNNLYIKVFAYQLNGTGKYMKHKNNGIWESSWTNY